MKNTSAMIELELARPISLELYKDYKELGRFMLRYGGSTLAAGLVTDVSIYYSQVCQQPTLTAPSIFLPLIVVL